MKKRVFIVHGWEADSGSDWFPWLKKELESRGYEVTVPDMPDTDRPNKETWVPLLSSLIGVPDENTYLIGHSIGANTVLRYLESLHGEKVGGVVLAAPYYGEVTLESGAAKKIADPWLNTPIDFSKVKRTSDEFVCIFSDNDEWVSIKNKDFFEKQLSPRIIVEHDKSHLNMGAGITELPSALESIVSFDK